MTAQKEFDETYITSSEIGRIIGVTRSAVIQARQKGILPDPIFIETHQVLWKRVDVQPHVDEWLKRRKERLGIA